MKTKTIKGMIAGAAIATVAVVATACASTSSSIDEGTPGAVRAINLMAAWVDAGAPNGGFDYTDLSGNNHTTTYDKAIQPMFSVDNYWAHNEDGEYTPDGDIGASSCVSCHGDTEEGRADSAHEMNLGSWEGVMGGADALSKPPGVALWGESKIGATDYKWKKSKMKGRMRNNRMPAGMLNDHTEENRDGPCLKDGKLVSNEKYVCDAGEKNALNVMAAWVDAGAKNDHTFNHVILPMFTQDDFWAPDTGSCVSCHGDTEEGRADSAHEMNLGSWEGVMGGADALSKPPGVALWGESKIGATDYKWKKSKMKGRMRNNRMPAGMVNDHTEENRDGPIVVPN